LQRKGRIWNVTNFFEFLTEHLKTMTPEEKEAIERKLDKF
jgi:hypothetical protein